MGLRGGGEGCRKGVCAGHAYGIVEGAMKADFTRIFQGFSIMSLVL